MLERRPEIELCAWCGKAPSITEWYCAECRDYVERPDDDKGDADGMEN